MHGDGRGHAGCGRALANQTGVFRLNRTHHRMSKDDERKVQTSETLIEVVMIRLLIARQGRRN
jgi:hypothetical protein